VQSDFDNPASHPSFWWPQTAWNAADTLFAFVTVLVAIVSLIASNRWTLGQVRQDRNNALIYIYYAIWYATQAAQKADGACVLQEIETLIGVIEKRLGPVLALCGSVGGQLNELRGALKDSKAKTSGKKGRETVVTGPGVVVEVSCGEGSSKGDDDALTEQVVRARVQVEKFAKYWSQKDMRLNELSAAQRDLNQQSPPPPPAPEPLGKH
jgi:hypothetical protein